MDCGKIGRLIRELRMEKGITQRALADRLGVSDRTVSKWERGRGAPDLTLLGPLSEALGVKIEGILRGELAGEDPVGGNMRKNKYYYCAACGNLIMATGSADISCCGRRLEALERKAPDEAHTLSLEAVEDEWYITTAHPMEREHFITFAAFVTPDRVQLIKLYPEWELQQRIPRRRGLLLWHCSEDGLFGKII